MAELMIATDLDNTLVGPAAEHRLALRQLNALIDRSDVRIAYVTGRSYISATRLMAEAGLLIPTALVTSVGTEIYFPADGPEPDALWWQTLQPGWDVLKVERIAECFSALKPQDPAEQGPFKRSYLVGPENALGLLPQLESDLKAAGLQVRVVYSMDKDLDILPLGGVKGKAVQFLQQRWGISPERTAVCGDSGNDQSLFEISSLGIAVGNAQPELRQWLENNHGHRVYQAQAHCAAGIEEGLHHWKLLKV
ncbi:MAG: sucrose-phosphate phosphatase [Gemmatimonadaceae bacterium]|nr:sucrose-phosphate phosphatase [Gloeobacterales cyanobacterium ES-bin-141]